jgi:hypothetical protein
LIYFIMNYHRLVFAFVVVCFTITTANAQVPGYVPSNGLSAWYSFTANINDLSGNGNTPTNSGATFVADRFGSANSAIDFNGTSAVMTLNTPSFQFSETGEFTYSVWLKKRTQTSAGVVLMNGTNTAGNFISNIQGQNSTQAGVNKQQSVWAWADCAHTLNVWVHYAAVYSGGILSIYKNGSLCDTVTYSNSGATAATMPLYFGRGLPGNSNFFTGTMDDIGIWTRALSLQEITALYTFNPVGLEEFSNELNFLVYPNPAFDIITVKLNTVNSATGYSIFDQTGSLVLSGELTGETTEINIKNLAAGIYFFQTVNGAKQTFNVNKE